MKKLFIPLFAFIVSCNQGISTRAGANKRANKSCKFFWKPKHCSLDSLQDLYALYSVPNFGFSVMLNDTINSSFKFYYFAYTKDFKQIIDTAKRVAHFSSCVTRTDTVLFKDTLLIYFPSCNSVPLYDLKRVNQELRDSVFKVGVKRLLGYL